MNDSPQNTFSLSEEGINLIAKQAMRRAIPISIVAIIAGLSISFFSDKAGSDDLLVFAFTIPIAGIAMSIGFMRAISRQKAIFSKYRLTLAENSITREQANTPTISLKNEEITSIVSNKNGSITIAGKSHRDVIGIPVGITDYDRLLALLSRITTISPPSKKTSNGFAISLLPFATLALMATVYLAPSKSLVATCGILLLAILSWSFIETRRSKNIDKKTKAASIAIVFVGLAIAGVILAKLLN